MMIKTERRAPELARVDLSDPRTFVDYDLVDMWRRFRTESPVHFNPSSERGPGFWAISRYDDVLAVYKDNIRFTSEYGNVLTTLLQGSDSASGKMLAVTDGDRHREIRKLMLKSFSPRVLAKVVDQINVRTTRLLAEAIARGECDFAMDVADHIPINTIGDLMDIPAQDRAALVDWNTLTLSGRSAEHTEMDEWMARNEILLYFSGIARRRRRDPGDDVISALATAIVDGSPLTEDEIVFNCYSLILGADESSRMSSIGAVLALAEHPEQWHALKSGQVDVASAVDEVLRWTTPAMHFGRRAVTDVELGGQVIKSGDIVTLWNTAANYDETVFVNPDVFDLARTPNKHVTFGYGPHFCLGAFLGRAHVGAVLAGLRSLVTDIRVTGDPVRLYSNFVYGYSGAPVQLIA